MVKNKSKILRISKGLRGYRKIHKYLGIFLLILVVISALTGLLLAWKKDVAMIQPPTQEGKSNTLNNWLPIDKIGEAALKAMEVEGHNDLIIDRIDVRPDKGVAKVLFKPGNYEVQIDGSTGEILSTEKRYSDLIEQIHDGSIISDLFKLISMNVLGLGLLFLTLSGFWLWYGPKKIRKIKKSN